MSAQGIAAVLTSAASFLTALGAVLHSVQTRRQVRAQSSAPPRSPAPGEGQAPARPTGSAP